MMSGCRACCIWQYCDRRTPTPRSEASICRQPKVAPGVRLVLSGKALAGKIGPIVPNWVIPGSKVPFRPVVATDCVRFVGECVALVVAETLAQAYDARGMIEVRVPTCCPP